MRSTNLYTAMCVNLHLLSSGSLAFTTTSTSRVSRRTAGFVIGSTVATPSETTASSSSSSSNDQNNESSSSSSSPPPTWESKQHLYGVDMMQQQESDGESIGGNSVSITLDAGGEVVGGAGGALPLPQTYVTCGKCSSLFAIAEEDLGRGKGCRVKCGVCAHTWYQSRDRLFDIPTETHDMIPANKSDLDRIARNLARDIPPGFTGVFKLYVGNLDFRTTSDQLLEFFENGSSSENARGSVCDVSMVKGPDGRSRGFAFVTFYNEEDGRAALRCNGMECNGRELSVKEPNN